MTNPHKNKPTKNQLPDNQLPRYLDMQHKAQSKYELEQSIDSALYAAEQAVVKDKQAMCYQMWSDQLMDQLHEEFAFEPDVCRVDSANALCEQLEGLLERCQLQFKLLQGPGCSEDAFQLALKAIFERSLMDTLDLMYGQELWRFDLQRKMQKTQDRLIESASQLIF